MSGLWLKVGTLTVCGILLFLFIVGGIFEIRRYLRNLEKRDSKDEQA
ncbi:MAG: hypothetical protein K6T78_16065 [Alicyclobacillus sp.]|nr:hypothetical protein [Alicyclobacillus sp.]